MKPTNKLLVSFIIPALNEATMIAKLLNSIEKLNEVPLCSTHEIIVVDACSSDNTKEIALAHNCKVVQTKPGQVASSRNLGAANATGNVLAFIDADCELPTEWLAAIANELIQDDVIAVGATMSFNESTDSWVERAWFELVHKQSPSNGKTEVSWLATFNLAVKKSAFDAAGHFDDTLTTCEDVDLGYRLHDIGKLVRLNQCGVLHHGESRSLREFFRREAWRARGTINILIRHWKNPRELAGFFLPLIIFGSILLSLACLVIILCSFCHAETENITTVIYALTFGPALILILLIRRNIKPSMLLCCGLLLCVYFCARVYGTLRPMPRLERNG